MSSNTSSQCQLFQLHIDAYIDGELEPARSRGIAVFICSGARLVALELAYAQRLHRGRG